MREKYVIRVCNAKTKDGKFVGVFYSKKRAVEKMKEYFAGDKERLLKRMSESEFEKNYSVILSDRFANIWELNTKDDVCIYWIVKVEDA